MPERGQSGRGSLRGLHKNVTAIASLKDIPAVILVRGGQPDDDMLEHAKDEDICILVSKDATYQVCGKLYALIG